MPSLKNIRYPLKNFVPRCAYPLYCACMLSCSTVSDSLWPHELLSMGFPRQEYQSELPFPSPGYLPNPVIKPMSLALVGWFFSTDPPGKPLFTISGMRIKFQCLFSLIFFFPRTTLAASENLCSSYLRHLSKFSACSHHKTYPPDWI